MALICPAVQVSEESDSVDLSATAALNYGDGEALDIADTYAKIVTKFRMVCPNNCREGNS